jgi:hypothetical protein
MAILIITFIDRPLGGGAGDRTYKDKDLPSKSFHSKETGTEKIQIVFPGGQPALTCAGQKPPAYLTPGSGAWVGLTVALISLAPHLGPDHLAPRRWAPELGAR